VNKKTWSIADARRTWSIANWGEGYFDIGDDGALRVRPRREDGPEIRLPDVVAAAQKQGSRLPLLVRFSDILRDRRERLQAAFAKAMREFDYPGGYTAIYPIKVNQQKGVAGELAASGGEGFGLEAGSKPELMAVLALAKPGSVVICNGYKDREYVRLALIGRKLGLEIYIVIEKPSELAHVLTEARTLDVEPLLGREPRRLVGGVPGGDLGRLGMGNRSCVCRAGPNLHIHLGGCRAMELQPRRGTRFRPESCPVKSGRGRAEASACAVDSGEAPSSFNAPSPSFNCGVATFRRDVRSMVSDILASLSTISRVSSTSDC